MLAAGAGEMVEPEPPRVVLEGVPARSGAVGPDFVGRRGSQLFVGRPRPWRAYAGRLPTNSATRQRELLQGGAELAQDLKEERDGLGFDVAFIPPNIGCSSPTFIPRFLPSMPPRRPL